MVRYLTRSLVFLSTNRYGEKRKGSESAKELSGVALLSATMNQCKKANQQLLVPITVWIGMEQAFIGADFTQVNAEAPRSRSVFDYKN